MTAIASHAIQLPSYPGSAGTAGTATLVAFALCAALIALALFRALYARYSRPRHLLSADGAIAVKENGAHGNVFDGKTQSSSSLQQLEKTGGNGPRALSWAFFWKRQWTGFTLPLSLHMSETPKPVGTGVGVAALSQQAKWEMMRQSPPYRRAVQGRATTPLTPPPSPSPYDGQPPLSAAKLIMSRHTYRRPNPNRHQSSSAQSKRSPPPSPTRAQPPPRLLSQSSS